MMKSHPTVLLLQTLVVFEPILQGSFRMVVGATSLMLQMLHATY